MTLHIRRVVTGHDADGKAVIVADGECAAFVASALNHAAANFASFLALPRSFNDREPF